MFNIKVIIMLQIAVCGKPNVGKSSFFNSATASAVEMAIAHVKN